MAWTVPRDWVADEVVTAVIMNSAVRDNLRYLKGLDGDITFEDDILTAYLVDGVDVSTHEARHVSGGADDIDSALAIAAMADLTLNKVWKGDATNRPAEVDFPTKTLNPANETVEAGYYVATTLSAVDADLAVGNIINTATIFGFLGTAVEQGVETIEMFAEGSLASGVAYTPASAGIYFAGKFTVDVWQPQYQSGAPAWLTMCQAGERTSAMDGIGDGTNFRLYNDSVGAANYQLMRHHMSLGTYELATADLAAASTYTPSEGFLAMGSEGQFCMFEQDLPTTGWTQVREWDPATGHPYALVIGDGVEIRIINNDGANARWYAMMRAVMT